jgi:hypothetical protein
VETWPEITEPLLRERQAMSDQEFFEFLAGFCEAAGTRVLDDAHYEQAITYPWGRRPGSCLVTGAVVEDLETMAPDRRDELVSRYIDDAAGRVPLLAYGANASPDRLALKLAHLPEGHREALIVAGDLTGFDVGAASQPPLFLTMPATVFASPGTRVRVAVLFLDSVQFTALWWTELSYKLGALSGVELKTDVAGRRLERVLAFSSRYGAFCVNGAPVALAAIAAQGRRGAALTQAEVLGAAARLVLGEGSTARDLIKAAYENPAPFLAEQLPAFRAASAPFVSAQWAELPV